MILKEEVYRIQDLMSVSRKVLIEAKVATASVDGSCLKLSDYSKSFTAALAGTEERAQDFINGILDFVKKNTPELYSKWEKGGTLSISDSTLIGCASNRVTSDRGRKYVQYSAKGGRPVLPTMNNEYVVTQYSKTSYNEYLKKNGIPNLDYPEYDVFFEDDLKYAEDRVNNLWAAMKPLLTKNRIVFKTEPKIDKHIVDTGGRLDENRDKSSYPNPGQVVLFYGKICEYSPATETTLECIKNIRIEYNYDEVVEKTNPHHCDFARFTISANGIPLKRIDGKEYASTNNAGKTKTDYNKTGGVSPFNDVQPDDRPQEQNDYEIKPNKNYRYNTFVIDEKLAQQIIAAGSDPNVIVISSRGILNSGLGANWKPLSKKYDTNTKGSIVHKDAARVIIWDDKNNVLYDSCASGTCTGGAEGDWPVNVCQAKKQVQV